MHLCTSCHDAHTRLCACGFPDIHQANVDTVLCVQVYVMVNEALSDNPADTLDYSMKLELDQVSEAE